MDIRSYFNARFQQKFDGLAPGCPSRSGNQIVIRHDFSLVCEDVIHHLNDSVFFAARLARSASEAVTGTPPLYKQDGCTETRARDKPWALPLAKVRLMNEHANSSTPRRLLLQTGSHEAYVPDVIGGI
jgi:hypothetical protein